MKKMVIVLITTLFLLFTIATPSFTINVIEPSDSCSNISYGFFVGKLVKVKKEWSFFKGNYTKIEILFGFNGKEENESDSITELRFNRLEFFAPSETYKEIKSKEGKIARFSYSKIDRANIRDGHNYAIFQTTDCEKEFTPSPKGYETRGGKMEASSIYIGRIVELHNERSNCPNSFYGNPSTISLDKYMDGYKYRTFITIETTNRDHNFVRMVVTDMKMFWYVKDALHSEKEMLIYTRTTQDPQEKIRNQIWKIVPYER